MNDSSEFFRVWVGLIDLVFKCPHLLNMHVTEIKSGYWITRMQNIDNCDFVRPSFR
jgi:hypothetical protein